MRAEVRRYHIAPSMWRAHMSLQAQGILLPARVVSISWNMIHTYAHTVPSLVSNSRMSLHSRKCTGGVVTQTQTSIQPSISNNMSINNQLGVTPLRKLNLPTLIVTRSHVTPGERSFPRGKAHVIACNFRWTISNRSIN